MAPPESSAAQASDIDQLPDEHPEEFDAFALYKQQRSQGTSHWLGALFSSSLIYVLLAVAALTIGTAARQIVREKEVEVTFVEEVVKEEAPPPPIEKPKPPPPVVAPAPAAAAPLVPNDMKVNQLDQPPPAKELVAPTDMPLMAPLEADPSLDRGIDVYGNGAGDVAGLEGGAGYGAGGAVGIARLPEDADKPVPSKSNQPPLFPDQAKQQKQTGTVLLRVVILASGAVSDVTVLEGEEPFAGAAVKAVKKWRYRPARFRGEAITVYQVIKIPFKLKA